MGFKIYTKTGDQGSTGLVGGKRLPKSHPQIESYGSVDELNSQIGVIVSALEAGIYSETADKLEDETPRLLNWLLNIQNELFQIGSLLACSSQETAETLAPLYPEQIQSQEGIIDFCDAQLPQLKAFILPGGHPLAAQFHLARTVCRRAERDILKMDPNDIVSPLIVPYLNRLSDLLFILARYTNLLCEISDQIWVP